MEDFIAINGLPIVLIGFSQPIFEPLSDSILDTIEKIDSVNDKYLHNLCQN